MLYVLPDVRSNPGILRSLSYLKSVPAKPTHSLLYRQSKSSAGALAEDAAKISSISADTDTPGALVSSMENFKAIPLEM